MISLRRVAELASRGRRLTRRTPKAFGRRPLVVSPDASLRWMRGDPWRDDMALLDAVDVLIEPGNVVWDLGANVGAFGVCAAHRSGNKVLMVEADSFLVEGLKQTISRNPELRIDVLGCAVGHKAGIAQFAVAGRGRNSSGLVDGKISTQHGESRAITPVALLTADMLLEHFETPDVVKVDLEGGEAMFVAGASRLIDEIRPSFYIEVHRDNRPEVLGRFRDAGYDVRQRRNGAWIDAQCAPVSDDFFAIPSDRGD